MGALGILSTIYTVYIIFVVEKQNVYVISKCMGFLDSSAGTESTCNAGDLSSIPGLGRSPGGRHGSPLQCSCLKNPHGQRSLAGYSPRGHKELDMTERLSKHPYLNN